ncbi:TlpA family protein disulfide reductase [Dyadobacter sp. CY345]|uniref:TlpA family protein disulfide reductase n=1 Tax=Dyadobacter sp. CY345 TaxID=2909335 RepID=UPI001F23BE3C|nr:TlpA disulfide reductase family protein [Dyadobacter sp. CY345]MCF2446524.1 TlpA family protein disulfide reductase [Dyadobacter sp. CY345]
MLIYPSKIKGSGFGFYYNDLWKERPTLHESDFKQTIAISNEFPIRIISIESSSRNKNGVNTSFVLFPNDTVFFSRKDSGLIMETHKNNRRNNELRFFSELNEHVGQYEGYMVDVYPKNWTLYQKLDQEDINLKKRREFLDNYSIKYEISSEFIEYLKASFYYKMINKKFDQLQIEKTISDSIRNVYDNYIFKQSREYWYLNEYSNASLSYMFFKSMNGSKRSSYMEQLHAAKKIFSHETFDVVALGILNNAKTSNSDSLTELVTNILNLVNTEKISKYIEEAYLTDVKYKHGTLPNDRHNILIDKHKNGRNISDFLNQQRGKIVYLDFWASWCAPCRQSMPASHQLREKFKDQDIIFVYISIDKNSISWKKASEEEGLDHIIDNYLLTNGKGFDFLKGNHIESIPRYMIFGKDGMLINGDAPRPESGEISNILNRLSKK